MIRDAATGRYAVTPHWLAGVHIGLVTDVADPDSMGRVQVVIPAIDAQREAPIWARVAVPFAGNNFGAFFIPDVGTEVLVAFTAGDASHPVIIGNLWNGAASVPESLPGSAVDRWTLTGKNGTRIAIVEESASQEKVEITTPAGNSALISDEAGGKIKLEAAGSSIEITTSGITIQTGSTVTVNASQIKMSAGMVNVDAGMSKFSGVVQCDTLVTNSVISSSYTPGAGNVW
jgi:uncharacterized protein involved in type VI secretion and phage assembly